MTSTDANKPSYLVEMGRQAGVGLHFSSLPNRHGIGDIADSSHAFVDFLAETGIGVWQYLPTGPTAYGDSPYQPLSAFAGNAMLVGLDPLVRLGLLREEELESLGSLPASHVNYGELIPAKRALLNRAVERMTQRPGNGITTAYEQFLHENASDWLDDYALFRVLKTLHGERPWPEWDRAFVHRESIAMKTIRNERAVALERTRVTQFLFHQQWNELKTYAKSRGVKFFGDMPIYIALDSSDAWVHGELLEIDRDGIPSAVAGVPPDYFSEDGQLWGNPLYDWGYHEQTGYRWWVERVRHATRQSDLVRIDHFRGFEAYWAVPWGAETARNGEWRPGPCDGLFEAIESKFGRLPIVAEDLGVITPEVDALRMRHGIPGMVVLQFDIADPEFNIDCVEENSVCYTGTHDNDTTMGWFRGSNDDTLTMEEKATLRAAALKHTGGSPETIHNDMIRLAFASKAALAVAPMQDFLGLGSEARFNIPGTTMDNWRWRLDSDDLQPAFRDSVANMVQEGRRG